MATWKIICSDIMIWCKEYTGPKFHALLTDCPYEMKFMGKVWDGTGISFQKETWAALAEHLLLGGFLFVFASSKGWHRLACAIEDSGLIIRPSIFNWQTREVVEVPFCLGWATGSSFPKATRIDTQIDKAAGKLEERETIERPIAYPDSDCWGTPNKSGYADKDSMVKIAPGDVNPGGTRTVFKPATDLARAWEGHRYGGQILKNALEPIIVAQKPWEGKRLDCIVGTGAGSLWVAGARIGVNSNDPNHRRPSVPFHKGGNEVYGNGLSGRPIENLKSQGRWPANFCLIHSPDCRRVGVKRVKGSHSMGNCEGKDYGLKDSPIYQNEIGKVAGHDHVGPDGMETVDDFQCSGNCPVAKLDLQAGERKSGGDGTAKRETVGYEGGWQERPVRAFKDSGGPSRFYHNADWSHEVAERIAGADPVGYCPKAAKRERQQNLDDFYWRIDKTAPIGFVRIDKDEYEELGREEERIYKETGKHVSLRARGNIHSTVKPVSLCKHLAVLLSPPKEYAPRRILIPFCGTMSEGIGALLAGWDEIIGIDSEQDYCDIGEARMEFWSAKMQETGSSNPKAILKKKDTKKQDSSQMPLDLGSVKQKGRCCEK